MSDVANRDIGGDPDGRGGPVAPRSEALAQALAVVGDRWSLVIVHQLLEGPRRFSTLRRGIAGLSANVLTQRLRRLAEAGIAIRRSYSDDLDILVYDLTDRGRALGPIIDALEEWIGESSAA